eukprot:Skav210050  [mRNA]  locus=scaffold1016:123806:127160:+ [translate_table: standard]
MPSQEQLQWIQDLGESKVHLFHNWGPRRRSISAQATVGRHVACQRRGARRFALPWVPAMEGEVKHFDVQVHLLSGEEVTLQNLSGYTLGRQVYQMLCDKLPAKPGAAISLTQPNGARLLLQQSLLQQGFGGEGESVLSCTYMATSIFAAWHCLLDSPEEESIELHGLLEIKGL